MSRPIDINHLFDAELHNTIRFFVEEVGVPFEDAREIAGNRLGRKHARPRDPIFRRLGIAKEIDLRREPVKQVESHKAVRDELVGRSPLPCTKTLNIGGAKASVEVRR